ncbi:unnamed protein product, partial [Musa textilis]
RWQLLHSKCKQSSTRDGDSATLRTKSRVISKVPALGPPPAPGREKQREERESSSHVTHARCHGKPSDRCR